MVFLKLKFPIVLILTIIFLAIPFSFTQAASLLPKDALSQLSGVNQDIQYQGTFLTRHDEKFSKIDQGYQEFVNNDLSSTMATLSPESQTLLTEQMKQYEVARKTYLEKRKVAVDSYLYDPDESNQDVLYASMQMAADVDKDRLDALNELQNCPGLPAGSTVEQAIDQCVTDQAKKDQLKQLFGPAGLAKTLNDAQQAVQDNQNLAKETARGVIQDKKRAKAEESAACFYKFGFNFGNCILQLLAWIGTIITGIVGSLLWVAGHLFDFSVYLSISGIKGWLLNNSGVDAAWRVMRDVGNICFIFILLYIALGTVFEMKGVGGNTQRLVVNVVVIALFVNFSGFFARTIIDASNIIAYEFYIKMDGNQSGVGRINNIGWRLVEKLDLTRYYVDTSGSNLEDPQINRLSFFGIIIQTFGNVLIILAAVFVLLTASILFLIRTIYLIFLYMLGPIAFISGIVPNNKYNYLSQWFEKLINQAFFAPAFLIPLYLIFAILGNGVGTLAGANGNSFWGGVGGGSMLIVLMDMLIIGLLIGCIFVAKTFGAAGAKFATGAAGAGTLAGVKGLGKLTGPRAQAWADRIRREEVQHWATGGTSTRPGFVSRAAAGAVSRTSNATKSVRSAAERLEGTAFGRSDLGKTVTSAMKNPLLASSDLIGAIATEAGIGS
ncbi:MAG: hypothetical protein WC385_00850, partial [Candidatus Paceibacterota bacterium]